MIEPLGQRESCEEVGAGFLLRFEGRLGEGEAFEGRRCIRQIDLAPASHALSLLIV
jgi:hypothetical protein